MGWTFRPLKRMGLARDYWDFVLVDGVVVGMRSVLRDVGVLCLLLRTEIVSFGVSMENRSELILTTKRLSKSTEQRLENGATTGYESQLWQMADALRGSMDAAEYKHVVLGLLFLKYVSDAFVEARAGLEAEIETWGRSRGPGRVSGRGSFLGSRRGSLGISEVAGYGNPRSAYWSITPCRA